MHAVAEIAFRPGGRATVVTPKERFDLQAIDGIRRRVVKFGERDATIARASSRARYAVDLQTKRLSTSIRCVFRPGVMGGKQMTKGSSSVTRRAEMATSWWRAKKMRFRQPSASR